MVLTFEDLWSGGSEVVDERPGVAVAYDTPPWTSSRCHFCADWLLAIRLLMISGRWPTIET